MDEHKPCNNCAGGESDKVASPAPDRGIDLLKNFRHDVGFRGPSVAKPTLARLIPRADVVTVAASVATYRNGVLLPMGDAVDPSGGGVSGLTHLATFGRSDIGVPMLTMNVPSTTWTNGSCSCCPVDITIELGKPYTAKASYLLRANEERMRRSAGRAGITLPSGRLIQEPPGAEATEINAQIFKYTITRKAVGKGKPNKCRVWFSEASFQRAYNVARNAIGGPLTAVGTPTGHRILDENSQLALDLNACMNPCEDGATTGSSETKPSASRPSAGVGQCVAFDMSTLPKIPRVIRVLYQTILVVKGGPEDCKPPFIVKRFMIVQVTDAVGNITQSDVYSLGASTWGGSNPGSQIDANGLMSHDAQHYERFFSGAGIPNATLVGSGGSSTFEGEFRD